MLLTCGLAAWVGSGLGQADGAPGDPPAFLARVVFRLPAADADVAVVRFPLPGTLAQSIQGFQGEDSARHPFSCRVVLRGTNEALVQIDLGGISNVVGDCCLYGLASQPSSPAGSGTDVVFRAGISVRERRSPTLPTTWERLLYFMEKSTSPVIAGSEERLAVENFGETLVGLFSRQEATLPAKVSVSAVSTNAVSAAAEEREAKKKAWRDRAGRALHIVRLQALVLFPRDGEYRLAVSCRDSGYVRVDSELAAEVETGAVPAAWHVGGARWYGAGVHQVELLTCALDPVACAGWVVPGRSSVSPIPDEALLGPGPVAQGRFEVKGQFVHADFAAQVLDAFRFRERDRIFVPVRLTDQSRNPGGAALARKWTIGEETFEAAAVTRILSPPGVYTARLTVADALGATSTCERTLDCRVNVAREYAVDFGVGGVPAACFEDDPVSPYVVAGGAGPASTPFDLSWTFTGRGGKALGGGTTNLALAGPAVKIDLGKFTAAQIGAFAWRVTVAGIMIDEGTVEFDRPPFSDWPTVVVADRLCDSKGRQHVLVTSRERAKTGYEEPACLPVAGTLLLLDDSLVPFAVSGENRETYDRVLPRMIEGAPACRYESLAPAEESSTCLRSLAKLAALPGLIGSGRQTVILSIGIHDLLLGVDADDYERQLTAMVDKLLENPETGIVLVTPPPYPEMEARLRPFAVAVRRIGDARGIPVADLYTAFIGMKESGPFFERGVLALSPRGHRLAADRIAKALSGAAE